MPESKKILEENQLWFCYMRKRANHSALISLCKVVLIAACALIFMAGWLLMQSNYAYYATNTLVLTGLFIGMFFVLAKAYGGLRVDQSRTDVIFSLVLSIVLTDAFIFIMQALVLKHIPSFLAAGLVLIAHFICAAVWATWATRLHARLNAPLRTAVIYHDEEAEPFAHAIRQEGKRFNVVKELRLDDCMENLAEELYDVEAVFLCGVPSTERNDIIKFCVARGIQAYVRPRTGDILMAGARNIQMLNVPVLLCMRKSSTMYFSVIKRTMDIVFSVLMLIVFSPFMLGAAIAIKAQDGGDIFYRQDRYTRNGRVFKMIKFRSMVPNAEGDGVARLASEGDSRITPVGAFIRKTRIDELPQLINVLRGQMSIVGPRPERPEIAAEYRKTLPEFDLRLQVKAGLTGYAQVHGKYNTDPYDKLQMDLLYIANQSLVEDLKLMLYTLKVMFMKESTEGVGEGKVTAAVKADESVKQS